MSLTILLGGWIAASVILSPLIGRLLAGTDKSAALPRLTAGKARMPIRGRSEHAQTMRRNVATQLYRRQAGWPRTG